MNTVNQVSHDNELAKPLAAEDIRCGDVVAMLDRTYEFASFLWNGDFRALDPEQPVCMRLRGHHPTVPLRVKAVCMPFVLVKSPKGSHHTLDIRMCRLVRLSETYGKRAWKKLRKKKKKKKS